jgi:hypothetical protein
VHGAAHGHSRDPSLEYMTSHVVLYVALGRFEIRNSLFKEKALAFGSEVTFCLRRVVQELNKKVQYKVVVSRISCRRSLP